MHNLIDMPSHSEVIIKFTKSLETNFFNKLKQKPSWNVDEIEAEFYLAMIETLGKTVDEIMEGYRNLLKSEKEKRSIFPSFNINLK